MQNWLILRGTCYLLKKVAGTLFGTLLLFSAAVIGAQSQVTVNTSPKTPLVGERWVISLLIDHSVPDEVTVSAPVFGNADNSFSSELFMDSFTKSPRRAGEKVQTAIEYRFIPGEAGTFYIEPFTVTTPSGITVTELITLEVSQSGGQQSRTQVFKTFWEGAPAQLPTGEKAVFTLRLLFARSGENNTAFLKQLPPLLFMPEVPKGVILASLPLSQTEREGGILLKLNLVPLSASLRLSARTVQYENLSFEIPALAVIAAATAWEAAAVSAEEVPAAAASAALAGLTSAAALAELRYTERNHINGKQFSSVRRAAEEGNGIFNTKDESRWRRNLLLGLSIFIIFVVIVTPFACLMFVKGTFRGKVAFFCAVVIAALTSIYFYFFVDTSAVFKKADGRFAVTLATPLRRTADIDGEELFIFKEGQPVEVLLKSDSWLYVRSFDDAGNSGWIPAEEAIFY